MPQLRTLIFRIPAVVLVTERINPLFGAGLFFVTAGATKSGVKTVFIQRLFKKIIWFPSSTLYFVNQFLRIMQLSDATWIINPILLVASVDMFPSTMLPAATRYNWTCPLKVLFRITGLAITTVIRVIVLWFSIRLASSITFEQLVRRKGVVCVQVSAIRNLLPRISSKSTLKEVTEFIKRCWITISVYLFRHQLML